MKKLKLLFAGLLLFIGLTGLFAKEKPKVKQVTYVCTIDCESCKEKIMKNIPYEKGVKKVIVDIPTKEVTVFFREDKNSTQELEKAIEKLGYEADIKKPKQNKK